MVDLSQLPQHELDYLEQRAMKAYFRAADDDADQPSKGALTIQGDRLTIENNYRPLATFRVSQASTGYRLRRTG